MKVTEETLQHIVPKYDVKTIKYRLRQQSDYQYKITDHNFLKAAKEYHKKDLFEYSDKNHSFGYLIFWIVFFAITMTTFGITSAITDIDPNNLWWNVSAFMFFGVSIVALPIMLFLFNWVDRFKFDPQTVSDEDILNRNKYTMNCLYVPTMIEEFNERDITIETRELKEDNYVYHYGYEYPSNGYHLQILYSVYLNETQGLNINVPYKLGYDIFYWLCDFTNNVNIASGDNLDKHVAKHCPAFYTWASELVNEMDR
jgi:hypothetical protein